MFEKMETTIEKWRDGRGLAREYVVYIDPACVEAFSIMECEKFDENGNSFQPVFYTWDVEILFKSGNMTYFRGFGSREDAVRRINGMLRKAGKLADGGE